LRGRKVRWRRVSWPAGASGPVKVCGFPSLKIEGRHALLSDLQQKMAGQGWSAPWFCGPMPGAPATFSERRRAIEVTMEALS
jgi:hypothetical protein